MLILGRSIPMKKIDQGWQVLIYGFLVTAVVISSSWRGKIILGEDIELHHSSKLPPTVNNEQIVKYNNTWNHYLIRGNWDMAIDQFSRAIVLSPLLPNSYNGRGSAYLRKGEIAKAISDFSKAIGIDPNYAIAYSNRGIAYVDKGETDLAFDDFSTAIEKDASIVQPYNNRGVIYAQKGMMDKAIADFSKACNLGDQEGCGNLRKAMRNNEATKSSSSPTQMALSAEQSKDNVVEGTVTEANLHLKSNLMADGITVILDEYPDYKFIIRSPGIMEGMKVRLYLKGQMAKNALIEVSKWEQIAKSVK